MNDTERKQWLASLKVGERVAIKERGLSDWPDYSLYEVKHITPTRKRIDIAALGSSYTTGLDADGRTKRSPGSYTPKDEIEPITQQVWAQMAETRTRRKLQRLIENKATMNGLTVDQAKRILAILEEGHGKEETKQTA